MPRPFHLKKEPSQNDRCSKTEIDCGSRAEWFRQNNHRGKAITDKFDVRKAVYMQLVQNFHQFELSKDCFQSFYNLDAILSVGYRVNSKRGMQFRIWANRILKEHLVKGYTINQKRLLEQQQHIEELKKSINMVERSLLEQVDTIDEARAIVRLLSDFSGGLEILDDYDHETLATEGNTGTRAIVIGKEEFMTVVDAMRRDFDSGVFGKPKDASFDSSVNQIYQSF